MQKIDEDIHRAQTRPGHAYGDPRIFSLEVERVFARSWLPVSPPQVAPGEVEPLLLLPGVLDEPLVRTQDAQGRFHCLSNVCTHRGMQVVCEGGAAKRLRCIYHGRRFGLNGALEAAPGFEEALDFPNPSDDLPRLPHGSWGPLHFVGLSPEQSLEEWLAPMDEILGWLPLEDFRFNAARSRDYEVEANWALYLDNYLEGFHIPTVHKGLASALDVAAYQTRLLPCGSLQIGIASEGEPTFEIPVGHPDEGSRVAAWYFHLFPTTLVNAYPWGLSVNHVEPLGLKRTRVRFMEYSWRPELRDQGAGGDLHTVEMEDEAVVEATQVGVQSRLYGQGRYAPLHERAVHHFHRLLEGALVQEDVD